MNTLLAKQDADGFSRRLPTAVQEIVDRQIVWAKVKTMSAGARRASTILWGS